MKSLFSNIKARIRLSVQPDRKLSTLVSLIVLINLYGSLLRTNSVNKRLLVNNLRFYKMRVCTYVNTGQNIYLKSSKRTNNFLNTKQRFLVDTSAPVHGYNETWKRVDAESSRQSGLFLGVRCSQAKSQRFQLVD